MLRARSVALVGASPRPGSFGARMIAEAARSSGIERLYLVNPRYDEIDGRPCVPSLKHLDEPVDLVLLGVRDDALEAQLRDAAVIGARSAVIFGSAAGDGLRASLRMIATDAGMALCGAGCMGFINVADDLRATGYLERDALPGGPIALITHSGSVFSAMLRTRRALGYTLAVSSGQELVNTTADYLEFALDETDTRVVGLVAETVRDGGNLITQLNRAAAADVPVVLLPVGGSPLGSSLVAAHSGALAGDRATWEALAEGTGVLVVDDLAEFTDTLELLSIAGRARPGRGIATVHDSGAERTLVADLAHELGVPFAPLRPGTLATLDELLDEGLLAGNPLDLWGTGAGTRELFGASLRALGSDPDVSVVALAVDLVEEYDGDTAYVDAALDYDAERPLVVLTNLASAVDVRATDRLRAAGVPVLEGTRSGLVALRHLLALAEPRPPRATSVIDPARQQRWAQRLTERIDGPAAFELLADYGLSVVATRGAVDEDATAAAAAAVGYPVVLKTDEPGLTHKSDVGGVALGLADEAALRAAYRAMSSALGPRVLVSAMAEAGVELSLGIVRNPQLGPLVVVAAGGVLAELLHDRAVALPPLSRERAERLVRQLHLRRLLDGWRGAPAANLDALTDAIVAVGTLAAELGEHLDALDVNPVIVTPSAVVAVDALVVPSA